jgi:hypothetical protein
LIRHGVRGREFKEKRMAWNPSPEVAVARDAARKLKSKMSLVFWVTDDGQFGMATYGETMALCRAAGDLGKHMQEAAMTWGEPCPSK